MFGRPTCRGAENAGAALPVADSEGFDADFKAVDFTLDLFAGQ